jgi:hypothetical protein
MSRKRQTIGSPRDAVSPDPWARLADARRSYADAIARRDALRPGDPGYAKAVHEVGVAWTRIQAWERRAAVYAQRVREAADGDHRVRDEG